MVDEGGSSLSLVSWSTSARFAVGEGRERQGVNGRRLVLALLMSVGGIRGPMGGSIDDARYSGGGKLGSGEEVLVGAGALDGKALYLRVGLSVKSGLGMLYSANGGDGGFSVG